MDVIEAQCIVLVDEYGTERASLSCSGGNGGAGSYTVIHVNDDKGRPTITLQVDDRGNPSICLFTRNSAPGVSMAVNSGQGNGLSIGNSEGKPCIMMGVPGPESDDPRAPTPDITVIDEQGRKVWSVFSGEYEMPEGQHEVENDGE
jgi:hypothetical protein